MGLSPATAPAWRPGRADGAAALLLALLCVYFFWPLVGLGQVYFRVDFSHDVYPKLHWLHQRLSQGQPIAWSQDQDLGYPMFDSSEGLQLYWPARWILTAFDAVAAVPLLWCLHHWLAAFGSHALARALGASAPAALLAGIAVAFSGGMVHSAGANSLMIPQAWFPWMLLGLVLIQRGGPRAPWLGAAVMGIATGLALLGGHLGHSAGQVWALVIVHVAWCFSGAWRERLRQGLAPLGLAALLGGLLYAGQAQALLRLAAQSSRGQVFTAAEAGADAMVPVTFAQAVLPHALGRLNDNSFLGHSWRFGSYEPQGILLYAGVLGLVLALAGAWARRRDSAPWLAAWAFLMIYALGHWTPLFRLYLLLPPLSHMHAPLRSAALGVTLLGPLMAWGLDEVRAAKRMGPAKAACVLGAALLLATLALLLAGPVLEAAGKAHIAGRLTGDPLHPFDPAYYLLKLQRWLGVLRGHLAVQGAFALASAALLWGLARGRERRGGVWALGAALLLFVELAFNLRGFQLPLDRSLYSYQPQSAQLIKRLEAEAPGERPRPFRILSWGVAAHIRRSFPSGLPMADLGAQQRLAELLQPGGHHWQELDTVNVYPTPALRRLQPFNGWFLDYDVTQDQAAQTRQLLQRRRLYDLCGAKYLVSGEALKAPGLTPLMRVPIHVYRNERALPLAYLASDFSGGWDPAGAVAALTDPDRPESRWARPALVEDASLRPGQGGGTVRWEAYTDARWALALQSRADGVLLLSRAYYEGPWRAVLDGKRVPLLAANGALSAVRVPAGEHRVEIVYDDPLLARALALQALALGLALGLLAWAWRGGRPA